MDAAGRKTGGRQKGGRNKATIERDLRTRAGIEAAAAGLMPLDVILARMRGELMANGKAPTDVQYRAAVDAAPYLHPRLASTDTTVKSDNVHRVVSEKPVTEADWIAEHGLPANDLAAAPEDDESAAG